NLHLDAEGGMWISTLKGLVRRKGERWQRFQGAGGWTGDYVRSFAERAGILLITSFDGKVFRFANQRLEELPPPPGAPARGYFGYVDEAGKIWVLQHGFFGWWSGQRWESQAGLEEVLSEGLCGVPGRDGGWWVVQGRGLCKFKDGEVVERRALSQPILEPWSMTEDRDGELWVGSYEQGLYRIRTNGEVNSYTTANGLSRNSLRFMFEDREGNRWVGSS